MTHSTERRLIASGFVEYVSDEDRQLRFLRRIWWPAFITIVVIFAISVPVFYDQVKTACEGPDCLPLQRPAQPPGTSPSLRFYAGFAAIRESVTFLFFCIIALFLAVRGRTDRMALFTALVLVSFAGGVIPDALYALSATGLFWRIVVSDLGMVGSSALLLYFCLFPNGRIAPAMDPMGSGRRNRIRHLHLRGSIQLQSQLLR